MYRNNDKLLNTIYTQYWEELYLYAYKLTKDSEQTEDILQEIFISIWKQYDPSKITNIKSYLYTATKYKCFEFIKTRKLTVNELNAAYQVMDQQELMNEEEQIVFKKYLLEQIKEKAEELLPDKCLEVFKLRYYAEKSYAEISVILNISEHTVKNQLTKALSVLRLNLNYNPELFAFVCFLVLEQYY